MKIDLPDLLRENLIEFIFDAILTAILKLAANAYRIQATPRSEEPRAHFSILSTHQKLHFGIAPRLQRGSLGSHSSPFATPVPLMPALQQYNFASVLVEKFAFCQCLSSL